MTKLDELHEAEKACTEERADYFAPDELVCNADKVSKLCTAYDDVIFERDKRIAELEAQLPKWHKVSDEDLPLPSQLVRVALNRDGKRVIRVAICRQSVFGNDWLVFGTPTNKSYEIQKAIAWCELPQLPKEIKNV